MMDQYEHLEVVNEISEILNKAKIKHYVDPKIKTYDGSKPYLGIYRSSRRLFFTYYYMVSNRSRISLSFNCLPIFIEKKILNRLCSFW